MQRLGVWFGMTKLNELNEMNEQLTELKVFYPLQLLLAEIDLNRESWVKDLDPNSHCYVWHRDLYMTMLVTLPMIL